MATRRATAAAKSARPRRKPRTAAPPRRRAAEPARARPTSATLAPEWRVWIAQNLARGVAPDQILATLRANGVPAREARVRLAEISAANGALELVRRHEFRLRQHAMLVRMLNEAARTAAHPGAVERRATIPRDEFFDRYYATNTPVVITDLVTRWPAFARWTPAYFKERFGHAEVQMTDGRNANPDYDYQREKHFAPTRMDAFVDRVLAAGETNDFYLIARNYNTARPELAPLFDEVDWTHGYLDRETARKGSALWFGPAGTVTPLHHDTSNILFAQVYGRKRIYLVSPLETALWHGARAMYADWDPDRGEAEFTRRPELRDVLLREVVLEPGEALFIPVGWWHHVRSLSVSISLALNNFARPNPFAWFVPGSA